MSVRIEENNHIGNMPIPGKKEIKGVVCIVMRGEAHYDDVVTVFFNLEDAKKYCNGDDDLYIIISNVF